MKEGHNFRSHYYQKAGLVGVDQRKLLDSLLNQRKIDISVLRETCQKYPIPSSYRILIWKILLEILPVYRNNFEFYEYGNSKMYSVNNTVLSHLIRYKITEDTPLLDRIVHCHYLHDGLLNVVACDLKDPILLSIGAWVLEIFPDQQDYEKFYITRKLRFLVKKMKPFYPTMVEETFHLLRDLEPELYEHLQSHNILEQLPIVAWFERIFTAQFPPVHLITVWDKIIAGAFQYLIPVAVALVAYRKSALLGITDMADVLIQTDRLTKESSDVVMNQSLELWNVHGSQLAHIGQSDATTTVSVRSS